MGPKMKLKFPEFKVTLGYIAGSKIFRATEEQTRETVRWLRACATLTEDPGLGPALLTTAYNC